jgi:hypothetical protein
MSPIARASGTDTRVHKKADQTRWNAEHAAFGIARQLIKAHHGAADLASAVESLRLPTHAERNSREVRAGVEKLWMQRPMAFMPTGGSSSDL